MKTIVTRTALVLVALAMALFAWAGVASAQTGYTPGNPAIQYAGPFSAGGDAGTVGLGFGGVNAQPSSDPAAGGGTDGTVGGTGGGLAITGSEVGTPLLVGLALTSIGGVALVAARRREI